ncbi:MAG: ornithine carbamoyltransferase [Phycisphaera sp.]|nr:ornithine carbamoyltransferase [Phycisphaera sp.]
MTHFIDIHNHTTEWLKGVLDTAHALRDERRDRGRNEPKLAGRTLAMFFEKPSLRTRVSFEQAMYELGGHAIVLDNREVGLGTRESIADVIRVMNGMAHAVMARVFEHRKLTEMAEHATIPVINALSDTSHPCQALADIMTMQDEFGRDLTGRTLAFIGDGNNVARSLARLCAKLGMRFTLATPAGYCLPEDELKEIAQENGGAEIEVSDDPFDAVADADAVYTDTFVSMGQEDEKAKRLEVFAEYQVNEQLMARAPKHAIVLHCLPAYRGVEITDAVMDGPQSRVFPQAHNRLHAQKGVLATLLT